jgi:hypothetical protein
LIGTPAFREAIAELRALAARGVEAAAQERRGEVREWRIAGQGSDPHHPEPWASERAGQDPFWSDDGWVRVGFDEEERPVLAELHEHVEEVQLHGDDHIDVLDRNGWARRWWLEDGRPTFMVQVTPLSVEVERWTTPLDGHLAAVYPEYTVSERYVAEVDDEGRLERLARAVVTPERKGGDQDTDLEAALDTAAELETDHVVYDARLHRREPRLPPSDEILERLLAPLEAAVVDAVREAGVERAFAAVVDGLPPVVWIGSERFRDHARAVSPADGDALSLLSQADPPDAAEVRLVDRLDPDALRACRELNWAADADRSERVRGEEIRAELDHALALRLNERAWDGTAEPFLVVVGRLDRTAQAVGRKRVAAFRASIASRARRAGKPRGRARHDRATLTAELARRGLERHSERLANEVAVEANRLVSGGSRSRLGGPALLPPGEPWPLDADGDPLTFLAGIDLGELAVRGPLPEAGWMLCFASLDSLAEPGPNVAGQPARMFYTRDPVAADPPGERLDERFVTPRAQLVLPDAWGAGRSFGLDVVESVVYDELAADLAGDAHWVLGALSGVQGEPLGGDVLLLHLSEDDELGLGILDAGSLQYRIAPDALAQRDWSAVQAWPDSA